MLLVYLRTLKTLVRLRYFLDATQVHQFLLRFTCRCCAILKVKFNVSSASSRGYYPISPIFMPYDKSVKGNVFGEFGLYRFDKL